MHTTIIAAACKGTWQQKWNCGWRQPVDASVAHSGATAGHLVIPAIAIGLILWAVLAMLRRRSGSPAAGRN